MRSSLKSMAMLASPYAARRALDVQVLDFPGMGLDELPPRLHVFAHKDGEDLVRLFRVLQRQLADGAGLGIHGRLPQLLRVHLTQALVPLDGDPLVSDALEDLLQYFATVAFSHTIAFFTSC